MKTTNLILIAISCLMASITAQSVEAQMETGLQPMTESLPLANSTVHSGTGNNPQRTENNPQGTDELQEQVLMQINKGLVDGWLSVADASQFKSQLNKLNGQETWYKSTRSQIPLALTEKNTELLNDWSRKLQAKPLLSLKPENTLHANIDKLISKALACNHISSAEAEKYYLRLAQLESNLEASKRISAGVEATAVVNKTLGELESEVMHKAD